MTKEYGAITPFARQRYGKIVAIALFAVASLGFQPLISAARAAETAQLQPAAGLLNCAAALPGIQRCITAAAQESYHAGNTTALGTVATILRSKLATDRGPALFYRTYWLAYTEYLNAGLALATKNTGQVKTALADADTLLDKLTIKDQEVDALQDLVLLLRFSVTPPSETGPLVTRTSNLRSRLVNATSIRALYALAVADYYTPKQYGGGRVAESLLRKALAAPEEAQSALKPTWGRDDCATLLIQILQQDGRKDEARSLYDKLRKLYPDSIDVAQLAGTF